MGDYLEFEAEKNEIIYIVYTNMMIKDFRVVFTKSYGDL